jgi:hypothetical protein
MSVKATAGIVAAVAITILAARDVAPAAADANPWLRGTLPVAEPLPPGHPPIAGSRLPGWHPPVEQSYPRLPEGHPPIPSMEPGCPGRRAMPDVGLGLHRDQGEVIST